MIANLRILPQLWNLSNRKLIKTKILSTSVRVGNGLNRCSKFDNMPKMTCCGIVWLRICKHFKRIALATTRTFIGNSDPITKITYTVDVLKYHDSDHSK